MKKLYHIIFVSVVSVFLVSGIVYAANTITSLQGAATSGISQGDMIAPSWYQEVNDTALMAKNTIPTITGSLQTFSGNISTLSGMIANTNFSQWTNYPNNTTPTGIYYAIGNVGIGVMPTNMNTKLTVAGNTDIQGSLKLANNTNLCTSSLEGSIRYNSTSKIFEGCDGTTWKTLKDIAPTNIACSLPWGGTLAHGSSITAYQSASVTSPATCVSESRTCNNGVLGGSYTNQNCSISYTYSWSTGGWGSCSASCGGGTQTRTVICQRNDGTTVADGYCSGTKPTLSQSCNTQSCCVSNVGTSCDRGYWGTKSGCDTNYGCAKWRVHYNVTNCSGGSIAQNDANWNCTYIGYAYYDPFVGGVTSRYNVPGCTNVTSWYGSTASVYLEKASSQSYCSSNVWNSVPGTISCDGTCQ